MNSQNKAHVYKSQVNWYLRDRSLGTATASPHKTWGEGWFSFLSLISFWWRGQLYTGYHTGTTTKENAAYYDSLFSLQYMYFDVKN